MRSGISGARVLLAAVAAGLTLAALPARAQDVEGAPPVFEKKAPPPGDSRSTKDPTPPDSTSRIRVQSPLVTTPVTVISRSGDFVSDLEERDFQILDNGVPQQIERFEIATDPIAVVIVVQTSDSVEPLIPQIQPLGPLFSDLMLGTKGEAAALSFADKVTDLQGFSNNGDRLATTLKSLQARGEKARLNDALAQAIAMLETRPKNVRRVIVVFSDGFDKGSETGRDDVIRRATGSDVTIYGLGLSPAEALLKQKPEDEPMSPLDANLAHPMPPGVVPTPTNSARVWDTPAPGIDIITAAGEVIRSEVASSPLESYCGYTGGVFYGHWSKNKLQNQLNRIASEVHSQYEIAYVPSTLSTSGFHRIHVDVSKPDLKVRARAGYFYQKP